MTSRRGVLVLSHGTPVKAEEIGAFYTAIRRGRPPTPEQLDDLVRRYDAIGGTSPLTERTEAQVAGVAGALERRAPARFVVEGGTKYATPTIEEAAARLVAQGVDDVVGIVLSPLHAPMTLNQYHDRAKSALGSVPYTAVWSWWRAAGFAELVADRVTAARVAAGGDPLVLFSAHSLPVRVATQGANYPAELAACADAVARAAGLSSHRVCFQSAGRTADAWVGPDLLDVLGALDDHVHAVVVCPVGFVSDHLEVLFDIDIEAAAVAASRGIALSRTASLNDDARFCEILADVATGA